MRPFAPSLPPSLSSPFPWNVSLVVHPPTVHHAVALYLPHRDCDARCRRERPVPDQHPVSVPNGILTPIASTNSSPVRALPSVSPFSLLGPAVKVSNLGFPVE